MERVLVTYKVKSDRLASKTCSQFDRSVPTSMILAGGIGFCRSSAGSLSILSVRKQYDFIVYLYWDMGSLRRQTLQSY